MEVALYTYNLLLITSYVVTLSISLISAFRETNTQKRNLFLFLSLYLLFFIFDNFIISLTELFTVFGHFYNKETQGTPFIKTIIYLVNNYCQIWIVRKLRKDKMTILDYSLLIGNFLWMLIPFSTLSPHRVFGFYFFNQILLFYTGLIARKKLTLLTLSTKRKKYLKAISVTAILFAVLIMLEDSYVIFNIDQYNLMQFKIQNRNFSEDIFSLGASFMVLNYFIHDHDYKQVENILEEKNSLFAEHAAKQNDLFFQQLHLTSREQEICSLLLQHKSNQEIANQLYLSIGTVKTHIHNIYLKGNVNKRRELFDLYEDSNFMK